jgi:hypothetical protein
MSTVDRLIDRGQSVAKTLVLYGNVSITGVELCGLSVFESSSHRLEIGASKI